MTYVSDTQLSLFLAVVYSAWLSSLLKFPLTVRLHEMVVSAFTLLGLVQFAAAYTTLWVSRDWCVNGITSESFLGLEI